MTETKRSLAHLPLPLPRWPLMRVMITGSRDYWDIDKIKTALIEHTRTTEGYNSLVHGGARGADTLGAKIALELGWFIEEYPANWGEHGKSAGSIRNQQMIDTKPDLVIAFPMRGSIGTWDAVRRAKTAGIKVVIID